MPITPSISLTTGTLSPDERVNYKYGMVLGLDEFLQEQLYLVGKDRSHARTLHGYGTVSGLDVSLTELDDENDWLVTVGTGIGVDQWGREFIIDCDQCARIGAWITANGIDDAVAGDDSSYTLYVLAAYDECLDRLVPLPGQVCGTGDDSAVPSRIRDAWNVKLSWTPPPMWRWDTDRRLARLLSQVVVVEGLLEADSDEEAIRDAVLELANRADDGPADLDPQPPAEWKLPAESAADIFDRILTTWVTKIRPLERQDEAQPWPVADLAWPAPDSPSQILLSTITLVPHADFTVDAPLITNATTDDDGRPYLLHTQLIQEMRAFRGALDEAEKPVEQLVTLTASRTAGQVIIEAWFHTDDPVQLAFDKIDVVDDAARTRAFAVSIVDGANGFSHRWRFTSKTVQAFPAPDRTQLAVTLPGATTFVGDVATTLASLIEDHGYFLNQDPTGDVTAYAEVRADVEVPPPEVAKQVPTTEFVTIRTVNRDREWAIVEFWFHLQPRGELDDAFTVHPRELLVFDDMTGQPVNVQRLEGPAPWCRAGSRPFETGNVWRAWLEPGPDIPERGQNSYLRFIFFPDSFAVFSETDGDIALRTWIESRGLNFEGADPDLRQIVSFAYLQPIEEPVPKTPDNGLFTEGG